MTALSPLDHARRGARQSRYAKKALDAYDTIDPRAVAALRPHIRELTRFIEPCAGKGDLVRQLQAIGLQCLDQFDIAPRAEGIRQADALSADYPFDFRWRAIITNPPFEWPLLGQLIEHWILQADVVWLLLPANFAHRATRAATMRHCRKIVSIGQLRWEPGSKHKSVDLFAWYEFGRLPVAATTFHPRQITGKAA